MSTSCQLGKLNGYNQSNCHMSYFRDSPSHYSRRSPPRLERELIEEELNLKNALRSESQNRRLLDEIALLQIKLRKTEELQLRVEGLIKQNGLLSQQNEQLSRELAERRYELERIKAGAAQLQEREAIKSGQLGQVNRSLELEIELLKKERFESNKLYEGHIQKLQIMLEDKIKELDIVSIKFNDLLNEKEVSEIHFEQERNKLKNLMTRTSHDMERQLEYTKERTSTEKYVQIQTLKKNYSSQILLLQDQIGKLKSSNDYKTSQFESQLAQNRALRNRHEQQMKLLESQNSSLREKILKLEQLNRSEVVNIQVKYKDLQRKDTNDLISGHVQQIKTLIGQIEKLNWLVREKNNEINNLMRQKRDQKAQEEERELAFRAQIDTLKNKLDVQGDKATAQALQLTRRISSLADKLQRDSQTYHDRVNHLNKTINDIEAELKGKQNEIDRNKTENNIRAKEQQRHIEELSTKLDNTRRQLSETQKDKAALQRQFEQHKQKAQNEISDLTRANKKLETEREELNDKLQRQADSTGDNEKILRNQIQALKKNIALLEKTLSEEQSSHSKQMELLSQNLNAKIERLIAQYKRSLQEIKTSRDNQIEALKKRLEKSERDRAEANNKLKDYSRRYQNIEKHFSNPAEGSISQQRADGSLFESLAKTQESVINIF